MSRNTGPKQKINRRFGVAIFPIKKAAERKPYAPGQHGPTLRRKFSVYALGNNELQKLAYKYGRTKKQLSRAYHQAKSQKGVTGEIFLQLLETSLDSVVYLMGFAETRSAARQLVNHGHIKVNGKRVDIASYRCAPSDVVEVGEKTASRQLATRAMDRTQYATVPAWLNVQSDIFKGTINRLPTRDEMGNEVDEKKIIQFYSR